MQLIYQPWTKFCMKGQDANAKQVCFTGKDGRWQVAGFVSNLLDKNYIIDAGNTGGAFGIPTFIRGNPRLGGVEFSTRF